MKESKITEKDLNLPEYKGFMVDDISTTDNDQKKITQTRS